MSNLIMIIVTESGGTKVVPYAPWRMINAIDMSDLISITVVKVVSPVQMIPFNGTQGGER